jgi:hypothetical protein
MDAESQLEQACNDWQTLASVENEAIRGEDWPRLADCQQSIEALQPRITECLLETRAKWASLGSQGLARQARFRTRAAQLIQLEHHNSLLLEEVRQTTGLKLAQFQQASRTLRRLRASYVPAAPADWSTYS